MNYKVSLSAVRVPEETYPLMHKALDEGKIGQSEYVQEFEEAVARFVGARYCIAVSNGTMADAVAVAAMKEAYGMKRAIVPALTFIAQPNSVCYNGLDVVFADVGNDWQMDFDGVGYADEWKATNIYFPADLMGRIFEYPNLFPPEKRQFTIEDACESFGSRGSDGKYAGTYGALGTYSFFPSHTISTGEGGAIVTNDSNLAELCRFIRAHGAVSSDPMRKFEFPIFGFNARMTTMQAVLGIAVMNHIEEYLLERRVIFAEMRRNLGGFVRDGDDFIVPHAYPIEYVSQEARDAAMRKLIEEGIECRKLFSCIPGNEHHYKNHKGTFPNAERIASTHLYLPCHQNMTMDDVEYILKVMDKIGGRA